MFCYHKHYHLTYLPTYSSCPHLSVSLEGKEGLYFSMIRTWDEKPCFCASETSIYKKWDNKAQIQIAFKSADFPCEVSLDSRQILLVTVYERKMFYFVTSWKGHFYSSLKRQTVVNFLKYSWNPWFYLYSFYSVILDVYVFRCSWLLISCFPNSSVGKESACNAVDAGSIPGSGRSLGEGIGYPIHYSWASLVS